MVLKAISLFCGIGISDLALHEAAKRLGIEIKIIAALDNWDKAVSVYNLNLLPSVASIVDINRVRKLPPCDFIFGGPPCQPHSRAGKKLGKKDPRDMTDHTWDLVKNTNYLLENVTKLWDSPYCERLCASDYGDCTTRTRTFHSSLPLVSIPVLYPKTYISDIRDSAEDARILAKRAGREKAGNHGHYCEAEQFQSLTAHSWHGHDIRGYGKLMHIVTHRERKKGEGIETYDNDDHMPTIIADAFHAVGDGQIKKQGLKKPLDIEIRGFSRNISKSGDVGHMPTLMGNSFHQCAEKDLIGCRNPSILEMQRAHSIPEDWNWGKITKTDKGKMIANSWPFRMGVSVWMAFLQNYL